MRVITLNVNGVRSATKKGLDQWLADPTLKWDVVCLQEIKARDEDIPDSMRNLNNASAHYYPALRPGYSGVGLLLRVPPKKVLRGFGVDEFDEEGRYLQADYDGVSIVSVYFPSGSAGPERQASKFRFLAAFAPHLRALRARGQEIILCGDVNIAHKEIDLKNWRSNQKNSGFLPEERAWLTTILDEHGWVDTFRRIDPRPDRYTWWSNRGQAYAKNVGWRIDYQLATPGIGSKAFAAGIYTAQRFSDHAPLVIDYDHALT